VAIRATRQKLPCCLCPNGWFKITRSPLPGWSLRLHSDVLRATISSDAEGSAMAQSARFYRFTGLNVVGDWLTSHPLRVVSLVDSVSVLE
jgi:hypothetical protein